MRKKRNTGDACSSRSHISNMSNTQRLFISVIALFSIFLQNLPSIGYRMKLIKGGIPVCLVCCVLAVLVTNDDLGAKLRLPWKKVDR